MAEEKRPIGRTAAIWLGALISVSILAYLAVSLDWNTLIREFQRVDLRFIPLLLLVYIFGLWLRALRWRHLLPTDAGLSRWRLCEATIVGTLASFVLPLRAGEFVRPWILSRWQAVSFSAAFASVVTERVFDTLAVVILFGLLIGQHDEIPAFVSTGAHLIAAVAFVILALMIYTYCCFDQASRTTRRLVTSVLGRKHPKLTDKILHMLDEFLSGLRAISNFKELAFVIFWTAGLWLSLIVLYQCGLWAFGLDPSWWTGLSLCVMIALAVAAPGAPGFVGTFQLGCMVALGLYGLSEEFAVAYSIVQHAMQVLVAVLLGIIVLHRRGIAFADLKAHSHK